VFSYLDASRLLRVPPEFQDPRLTIRSLSIDTRTLNPGDLFVAFKGVQCDGHDFLAAAFEKGASGALIDRTQKESVLARLQTVKVPVRNLIPVEDPQAAMTELAVGYRKTLPARIIGVTGSVGKTTTKEFLFYLLRQKYKALATAGNLNNHLGVPIMLSRLEPSHQFCVMEMGANHPGEIAYLAGIAGPSGGILTPIGAAHLEGFGSLENVYKTKLELADALKKDDPLVVPGDDRRLLELLDQKGRQAITVGYSENAAFRIENVRSGSGEVSFTMNGEREFSFPGEAPFLALNAGLAIAMARNLGMAWTEIPQKWADVGFASGRFRETILSSGVRVIDDSYNANPDSVRAAIEVLACAPGVRRLVLGDMGEVGAEGPAFHREVGAYARERGIDRLDAVGTLARHAVEAFGAGARWHADVDALVAAVAPEAHEGAAILVKGSRFMRMERVVGALTGAGETVGVRAA